MLDDPWFIAIVSGLVSTIVGGLILSRLDQRAGRARDPDSPVDWMGRVAFLFRAVLFGVLTAILTWAVWVAGSRVAGPGVAFGWSEQTVREFWILLRLLIYVVGLFVAFCISASHPFD